MHHVERGGGLRSPEKDSRLSFLRVCSPEKDCLV